MAHDAKNLNGIKLDCDSTNGQLRKVYESYAYLRAPSGLTYKSKAALAKVDELCPVAGHGKACDFAPLVKACENVDPHSVAGCSSECADQSALVTSGCKAQNPSVGKLVDLMLTTCGGSTGGQ